MEYAPVPTTQQLGQLASELTSGGDVQHVRRLAGGLGCTMDVLEIREPGGTTRLIVLRRYGPWYGDRSIAHDEFVALRTADAGGVPVPPPIWLDTIGIFAEPAAVIGFIEGAPVLEFAGDEAGVDQLAAAAAQIHGTPVAADAGRSLPDLTESRTRELSEAVAPGRFAEHALGERLWERLRALLERTRFGDAALVHGDFWPGNVMWRDSRLVAVVDWEDAGVGDPAMDVAYCATEFRYFGRDDLADRFVDQYRQRSGQPLESLAFWTLHALGRALPDIDRWLPSWQAMGKPDLTAAQILSRHTELIERALAETA